MSTKLANAYKTIGEVVKILNNVEPKEIKINAHTLRFWETQFTQLKPKFLITIEDIMILKLLKF